MAYSLTSLYHKAVAVSIEIMLKIYKKCKIHRAGRGEKSTIEQIAYNTESVNGDILSQSEKIVNRFKKKTELQVTDQLYEWLDGFNSSVKKDARLRRADYLANKGSATSSTISISDLYKIVKGGEE